jgi:diguanylate cyclase (GGDEF)-like protein
MHPVNQTAANNMTSTVLKKIRKLNQQAWELSKKDGPRAFDLAEKAQTLLSGCADAQQVDEFECLKTQTYCLDMLSHPEEALPVGLKANLLAEQIGDKYLIGSIQSLLGRIYWHIDDFPTSMDYYLNALKLVQVEPHPDLEISLINGLGMVQVGLENYTEALGYFNTCLEKAGEDDLTSRADANNNIAYVLHLLGRDQEALEFGTAALALFNQAGNYVGKLHTLHTFGAIHFALGNYEEAMTFLQEGLALARQNNSQLLDLTYILEISRIHQIHGELDLAEEELLLALKAAEKVNSLTNISLTHERLVEIYKEKQDYQSALEHFEAFHTTSKKIFNDRSDRRVKNLEILHQVEITRRQADLYRVMANTDSLTGLLNRRRFMEIAEIAVQQAKNDRGQLATLMLDIDHFKNVNDQYGHQAGDGVLSAVAASIRKSLRGGDVAGRYGGEEFIILLVGASSEQCFKIAERIRLAIARLEIPMDQGTVRVTVSLGLMVINTDQDLPVEDLIHCADQALYRAKQQGRNRTVAWPQNERSMDQETPHSNES